MHTYICIYTQVELSKLGASTTSGSGVTASNGATAVNGNSNGSEATAGATGGKGGSKLDRWLERYVLV
jgi:hypothetical protein